MRRLKLFSFLIYRLIPNNVFIKDMGQPLMAVPTVVCHPGFLCFSDKISARYHCNIPRDPIVFALMCLPIFSKIDLILDGRLVHYFCPMRPATRLCKQWKAKLYG